jgi:glycosyltransferase involved in cell wall biosynthesis
LKPNHEIENPKLLYATSARLGGSGLDSVAAETVRAAQKAGLLGRAIAFENRLGELPAAQFESLRWNPVRLLSALGSEHYYAAKKHALDRAAAQRLAGGGFTLFHGWSGECVRTLREAHRLGIPSLIEIPTWHRNKGKAKPARPTKSERERAEASGWRGIKDRLLITRQQVLEEYDLADLILVLSEKAEETFLAAGIAQEKLFRHQRGVDVTRFQPAEKAPEKFVALFVGALIRRKGVHHLIDVWKRLALKDAELWLAGTVHDEIKPFLSDAGSSGIFATGFATKVEDFYRSGVVHVFPSECEGSAKCTYEAAASGLAQIITREAGDVVLDGVNGLIIPPNDPDALAEAILKLYRDRDLCARLGTGGRQRVVENFTWEHFGARLREAWRVAHTKQR